MLDKFVHLSLGMYCFMKIIIKVLLLSIVSSLYINTNNKILAQNYTIYTTDNVIYPIVIEQSDIAIDKNGEGYYIYVRKKGPTDGVNLLIEAENGAKLELYRNTSFNPNSSIKLVDTVTHPLLGESYYTLIPNYVYANTLSGLKIVDVIENMPIVAQSFVNDSNGNIVSSLDNNIVLQVKEDIITSPYLKLESVKKEGNIYSFILSYSGGKDGQYAFYVREGYTSVQYKKIPILWTYAQNDNNAIILNDTYKNELGKVLQIKVFFEELPEERYLAFNVFDKEGQTRTLPVDYTIPASLVITPPPAPTLPEIEETRPAPVRPISENDDIGNDDENIEEVTIITGVVIEEPIIVVETPVIEEPIIVVEIPVIEEPIIVVETPVIVIKKEEPMIEQQQPAPQRVIPNAGGNYEFDMEIIRDFDDIENEFNKNLNYVESPSSLPSKISDALLNYEEDSISIVIVMDSTQSMGDSISAMKYYINTLTKDLFAKYDEAKIGFVLFRDVGEAYITKKIDFMEDPLSIAHEVKYFYATGGGDKAEPIYEAIDVALKGFDFNSKVNKILVITDAPPKVISDVNVHSTSKLAKSLNVELETLLLPKSKNE